MNFRIISPRHMLYATLALLLYCIMRPGVMMADEVTQIPVWMSMITRAVGIMGVISLIITFPILFLLGMWDLLGVLNGGLLIFVYGVVGLILLNTKYHGEFAGNSKLYVVYLTIFLIFISIFDYIKKVNQNLVTLGKSHPDAFDGMAEIMMISSAMLLGYLLCYAYTNHQQWKQKKRSKV